MTSQSQRTDRDLEKAQKRQPAKQPQEQGVVATLPADLAQVQRAVAQPASAQPSDLIALQRVVGNQAATRLIQSPRSPAETSHEQAHAVTAQPQAKAMVQRKEEDEEKGGFFSRVGGFFKGVGKGIASGARAVGRGARAAGGALVGGAKAAGRAVVGGAKAVGRGAKAVGGAIGRGARSAWGGIKAVGSAIGRGARALWGGVKAVGGAIGRGAKAAGKLVYTGEYNDLDANQYRVTPDQTVEAVRRQEDEEGNVTYWVVGIVERFEGNRPIVRPVNPPRSLGNWYPKVTHINGMNVKPESGIKSALKLQQAVQESMSSDGVAVAPEVLYTYSAHEGFGADVVECITGKLRLNDEATRSQERIMLDAIRSKRRTTVSAHSRGTIKTDNAVRNVHAKLKAEYMPTFLASSEVAREARTLAEEMRDELSEFGLSPAVYTQILKRELAAQRADKRASEEMDKYIQLIYAGNAVQFPSSKLKGQLVVGTKDPISMLFGKYFDFATPDNMTMNKVPGGHGFGSVYAGKVGELIASDLKQREEEE